MTFQDPDLHKYPEHEKMRKIEENSHIIGEFLEWLESERTPRTELAVWRKSAFGDFLDSFSHTIESILAEYFHIDLVKVEQEKKQMLDEIRRGRKP